MKLVIDIPEILFEKIQNRKADKRTLETVIMRGMPLPKSHGRLIDAGRFIDTLNNAQIEGLNTYKGLGRAKELLIETPTIIEADKESEET